MIQQRKFKVETQQIQVLLIQALYLDIIVGYHKESIALPE